MTIVLTALALYVLATRFSPESTASIRWKVLALAFGWVVLAKATDSAFEAVGWPNMFIFWLATIAWMALMLLLLWRLLVRWCGVDRGAAQKTTFAFGGFVLIMSVIGATLTASAA